MYKAMDLKNKSTASGCLASVILFFSIILNWYKAPEVPIHTWDVLPLLPTNRISTRILEYSLDSAADLLPTYVGSVSSRNPIEWKGACFYNSTAWLEFHNKTGSTYGGGTLHLKLSKPHSLTCMDLYIFTTPYRLTWDYIFTRGEHKVEFKEWELGKAEYDYVKENGVSIFLMHSGLFGTLRGLWDVFPLFANNQWGENKNIEFLKKHMKATFDERPKPWVPNVDPDSIHSGDMLVMSKIRGVWGGFDTLEKWVTGAYAGHSAVCLRDSEGKLWVGESGRDDGTGTGHDIIDLLTWDEWWNFELTKDEYNPHIALLPLHPDMRAKFNEDAAWKYATSMKRKSYGYHNMIFSWIDTVSGNYPPPLNAHLVASAMTLYNRMKPASAGKLWREALNKRLGTEGLSVDEILRRIGKDGFAELLAVPEDDSWVYSDGKSATCIAYVLTMYKEAGLFGPLTSVVQATEFTVKDGYSLKIFEDDTSRLPAWCNKGDNLPFCQIRGKYRMYLPGYNTVVPYKHMNEQCPSLPPAYYRPDSC